MISPILLFLIGNVIAVGESRNVYSVAGIDIFGDVDFMFFF